jgi:hypothetical protein
MRYGYEGKKARWPPFSTKWQDPDDAPELTEEFFANAEVFEGNRFIRAARVGQRLAPPKSRAVFVWIRT